METGFHHVSDQPSRKLCLAIFWPAERPKQHNNASREVGELFTSGFDHAIRFLTHTDFHDDLEDGSLGLKKRKADKSDKVSEADKIEKAKRKKVSAGSEPALSIDATASSAAASSAGAGGIPEELKRLNEHSFTKDEEGKNKIRLYIKVFLYFSDSSS